MKKERRIVISRACHKKLIRWALLSKKEIAFYACARIGQEKVSYVHRLRNRARHPYDPRAYFFLNEREAAFIRKDLKRRGLRLVIEGHSHPYKSHPAHPSEIDVRWMGAGTRQIIVAPFAPAEKPIVSAWNIKNTLKDTLKRGRIPLIEVA